MRESGQIEQDADVVIFLHNKKPSEELEGKDLIPVKVIIAKQRNGPRGKLDFIFQKNIVRFREEKEAPVEDIL